MGKYENIKKTAVIMCIVILIALLFRKIGFEESNIILVFVVGVMFISKFTEGYYYGIIASILGVLIFNFFFTEPYYTFHVNNPNYIVTFIIMLIAALLTSTSTSKIKNQAKVYLEKEKTISTLYKNSKKLLNSKSNLEIIKSCSESIGEILNRNVFIQIYDKERNSIEYEYYRRKNSIENDLDKEILNDYLNQLKTEKYISKIEEFKKIYYYPIKGKKRILGVVCIEEYIENPILENEKIILKSILTQAVLAMEKEELYEENKVNSLQAHRERTRSNLLRSISHDLRTPLATILGSTSTIIENYEKIDDDSKKELLQNIYEDSNWLIRSVENILSVTRMDEGKLEIKKNIEIAEEIVADALKIVNRFNSGRKIKVIHPEDIIITKVDGLLIRQVLVNLIDNAIRHTSFSSEICVIVENSYDNTIFKVWDTGKGIPSENIPYIFERFYTKSNGQNLEKRGIGLGLSICKSIVTAHGGNIKAYNNKDGGATFEFSIPNN